jgi:hypothetical protein
LGFILNKFTQEFKEDFKEHIDLIEKIKNFTNELKRLATIVQNREDFIFTSIEFANISIENIDSIILNLESGYLTQSQILLRWHLESAHKLFYLWNKPDKYREWLNGIKIHPGPVRGFFNKKGLPSWLLEYDIISNIVHSNYKFVSNHFGFDKNREKDEDQINRVGIILARLMLIANKVNYVSVESLRPYMGKDHDDIVEKYNKLDNEVMKLVGKYTV